MYCVRGIVWYVNGSVCVCGGGVQFNIFSILTRSSGLIPITIIKSALALYVLLVLVSISPPTPGYRRVVPISSDTHLLCRPWSRSQIYNFVAFNCIYQCQCSWQELDYDKNPSASIYLKMNEKKKLRHPNFWIRSNGGTTLKNNMRKAKKALYVTVWLRTDAIHSAFFWRER